jgi:pimeloyl-ACP methyl ester carboxylesterase
LVAVTDERDQPEQPVAHRTVRTNGTSMHVAECGRGRPVLLCHGFPELWSSWRHQLPVLAEAGCHAIAPDQRGYGGTDRPDAVSAYDIEHLTGDLIGLLDAMGEERAVFVGHDWGAIVVWNLAVMAPDRVEAVVGMSVPFTPRPPVPPTELMKALAGDRFLYILYFQREGPADRELARDPRRTLLKAYWSVSGEAPKGSIRRLPKEGTAYLDQLAEPPQGVLPSWLSQEDLDDNVASFRRTGFTGALNWYRNFDRNWELTERFADRKVEQPALFVAGERDPVLRMTPPELMDGWVTDLRGKVLVPGAGHWVQQEAPEHVNAALLDFLSALPGTAAGSR